METTTYVKAVGKNGISATVIQDSICSRTNTRLTTFELEYPRFIHSEFMTHRLFSRNAASSRAIPVSKLIKLVNEKCATPIEWGMNAKGMQSVGLLGRHSMLEANEIWHRLAKHACAAAMELDSLKLHKQIVNRVLEPYQMIKVVCTATSYDNFFHLRKHPDAQPEIRELATVMWKALEDSSPFITVPGEWHVPYVTRENNEHGISYYIWEEQENLEKQAIKVYIPVEDAIKISASCCAQVSYRILNTDASKANDIFFRLVESKPVHASPLEHQATPMSNITNGCNDCASWEKGVTHSDRQGAMWSGNFKYWIQYRQLIRDHVCWKYEE